MLRKPLSGVLAAAMLLCLTACSDKGGDGNDIKQTESETTAAQSEETTAGTTFTQASTPALTVNTLSGELSPLVPEVSAGEFDVPQTEALQFVRNLKIGWNLGNTFDTVDIGTVDDELMYESAWCGSVTAEANIKALKAAGFNAVRIPVSWHNHLSDKDEYIISERWLDRVNEVVDYCIDQDMYVIINIHHDNSKVYIFPTERSYERSYKYVTSIWTQLSERFKSYDEHLIFDSLNEPRRVGHKNEWWFDPNNEDCREAAECINKLNQAFVDTVRASGGNNSTRYLMCPGYDASPDGVLKADYVIPKDIDGNDNRIMISVHAYTPYNFALEDGGTDTWSSENNSDVNGMTWFMDQLYSKYVSNGIPVIIDEFGARDKKGNIEARTDFAAYYVAAARARGMTCFWWDNNAFEGDGELFGLLDRNTNEWRYPEIVQAMMKYAE